MDIIKTLFRKYCPQCHEEGLKVRERDEEYDTYWCMYCNIVWEAFKKGEKDADIQYRCRNLFERR